MKKISVIIPCYNVEKYIDRCLQSVTEQTFSMSDMEILCINDASTDGTAAICDRFARMDSRIRYYVNFKNIGELETRLRAINLSKGEWIAFIDSDDIWSPDKLEKQTDLQKETGCALVYTASSFINENGKMFKWIMHVPEEVSYKRLLRQNIISNSSVLLRKSDFFYSKGVI